MNNKNVLSTMLLAMVMVGPASAQVWTSAYAEDLPGIFPWQGEYHGDGFGAQVIALNDKDVQLVLHTGGLPGDGWDGHNKSLLVGTLEDGKIDLEAASGEREYLAKDADKFSATKLFPPSGQFPAKGVLNSNGVQLQWNDAYGRRTVNLRKLNRRSPSMGAYAPGDAVVLFAGTNKDEWEGGRLDDKTKLLNTDGKDILTKRKFNNYRMHLEFLMPFRPEARGQGRGNSGFYQVDHYEMQILDSFGLEGLDNECGGIYQKANSKLNMCLPPLQWQTYDVEFHNAVVKDGKKIKNAKLTAKLNGVLIHDELEIDGKTGGSRGDAEGTPGPIKLQGHGNPLQYRNIWIQELSDAEGDEEDEANEGVAST